MKKRKSVLAAALCLVLGIGGCAGTNKEEHKTAAEKKIEAAEGKEATEENAYQEKLNLIEPAAYRDVSGLNVEAGSYFSIIGQKKGGAYWEQVEAGAKQAVEDLNEALGYEGKEKIKVTYSGPADPLSVNEQVNILDEELARYPIGISISLVDARSGEVQFDLAAGNGIPVVAFDSASDYQGLMALVSTDNRGSAQTVAAKLSEMMGRTGEVLVFIQNSRSMAQQEREAGFTEKIANDYPGVTVETYYMDQLDELKKTIAQEKGIENPEEITGEEALDYIIEKHPNVTGCFVADASVILQVTEALERAEKKETFVVGYDGGEDEIEALENGAVDGLMVQNPYGMGYASIVASARAALSMGNEAYINTGAEWVD